MKVNYSSVEKILLNNKLKITLLFILKILNVTFHLNFISLLVQKLNYLLTLGSL